METLKNTYRTWAKMSKDERLREIAICTKWEYVDDDPGLHPYWIIPQRHRGCTGKTVDIRSHLGLHLESIDLIQDEVKHCILTDPLLTERYFRWLIDIAKRDSLNENCDEIGNAIEATAEQRAEALWLTLREWDE